MDERPGRVTEVVLVKVVVVDVMGGSRSSGWTLLIVVVGNGTGSFRVVVDDKQRCFFLTG